MNLYSIDTSLAAQYLESQVGTRSGIANFVHEQRDRYRAFVLAPEKTAARRLVEFQRGGITNTLERNKWLTTRINSLFNKYAGGTLLIQDAFMRADERLPFLKDEGLAAFQSLDRTPYILLDAKECTLEKIVKAFDAIGSYNCLAVFLSEQILPSVSEHLTDFGFNALIASAREAYLQIYDQESFMVFQFEE